VRRSSDKQTFDEKEINMMNKQDKRETRNQPKYIEPLADLELTTEQTEQTKGGAGSPQIDRSGRPTIATAVVPPVPHSSN
jgi:hypothetical protein